MKRGKGVAERLMPAVFMAAVLAVACAAQAHAAENLIKNGDAETGDLANWPGFTKVVAAGAHGGAHCFMSAGPANIHSKELIPIDPAKTYKLTGWFKSSGKDKSRMYFGYVPHDAKKRGIGCIHVRCVPDTETTLAEACAAGDTIVKIVNGAKWQAVGHAAIAFNVDDSGKYADLPNRTLSSVGITKVENKGDHWEVHLKKACRRAYPAGTKIREQCSGGSYIYNAMNSRLVPSEWTEYTGAIKGIATKDAPLNHWWPGTAYAKIVLLTNYGQDKEFQVLVDDMTLTVTAP